MGMIVNGWTMVGKKAMGMFENTVGNKGAVVGNVTMVMLKYTMMSNVGMGVFERTVVGNVSMGMFGTPAWMLNHNWMGFDMMVVGFVNGLVVGNKLVLLLNVRMDFGLAVVVVMNNRLEHVRKMQVVFVEIVLQNR